MFKKGGFNVKENKTDALSENMSQTEAATISKSAEEERIVSENPSTEIIHETFTTAVSKPRTRKKSPPKDAGDKTQTPSAEKKTTQKRTTAKKTSDSAKKKSDVTKAVIENCPAEPTAAAKGKEEVSPVSELPNSDIGASPEVKEVSKAKEDIFIENGEPLNLSEDNHTEDCKEDEANLSFFRISNGDFDSSYSENETSDENAALKKDEEVNKEDEITPPDELFAYRSKPQPEITEPPAEEESDEGITLLDSENFEQEEPFDDGQYQFSNLKPVPSPEKIKSESTQDKYDPKKPRKIDGRFDLIELFVFTLLAVMILTTFFFRHSIVEGDSMKNTLHSGEHLIISDFFYTPKRGDIIVCEDYTTSIKKPIVKRVIAIEGDVITITPNKLVYVNGELLDESAYVYVDGIDLTQPIYNFTVPEDEIFVMGDHRNDSEDSRSIGPISEDAVLGKVILRFYPFSKFGTVK